MRLFRRILDHGLPFRHHGSHHHIHGSAHRYHIHINMIATESLRLRDDQTMLNPHIGSQRTEPFDMLVYRTQPNITATRKRHLCLPVFA